MVKTAWLPLSLIAILVGVGCAAPPADVTNGGVDQPLQADEEEASVLLSGIPSMDSTATGVDSWRVSLVRKKNQDVRSGELFLVAIGTHRGTEVIDVVLDAKEDLALVMADGSEPTSAVQLAVAYDLKDIGKRLNAARLKPCSELRDAAGFYNGTVLLGSVAAFLVCLSGAVPACLAAIAVASAVQIARRPNSANSEQLAACPAVSDEDWCDAQNQPLHEGTLCRQYEEW